MSRGCQWLWQVRDCSGKLQLIVGCQATHAVWTLNCKNFSSPWISYHSEQSLQYFARICTETFMLFGGKLSLRSLSLRGSVVAVTIPGCRSSDWQHVSVCVGLESGEWSTRRTPDAGLTLDTTDRLDSVLILTLDTTDRQAGLCLNTDTRHYRQAGLCLGLILTLDTTDRLDSVLILTLQTGWTLS